MPRLALENQISASTQNQTFAALLFLRYDVPGVNLPWLEKFTPDQSPFTFPSC